jgi:orotate phosphoribosyltransferase-like protein
VAKVKAGEDPEDKRHLNPKRTKRTMDLVEKVRDFLTQDRRVSLEEIADEFEIAKGTAFNIVHDDLGLSKKSARWVLKLLSDDQKEERVRVVNVFKKHLFELGERFKSMVVTMDESMVSFYTPETKNQSRQWLPKGDPALIKAKERES